MVFVGDEVYVEFRFRDIRLFMSYGIVRNRGDLLCIGCV
jgi:hypothetical protein